jgi:hypothetical protein
LLCGCLVCAFIARYPAPLPARSAPTGPTATPSPPPHSQLRRGWLMHTKPAANPHSCCTNLLQAYRSACVSLETREIGFCLAQFAIRTPAMLPPASKIMHIVAPQPWTRPSYTTIFRHPSGLGGVCTRTASGLVQRGNISRAKLLGISVVILKACAFRECARLLVLEKGHCPSSKIS